MSICPKGKISKARRDKRRAQTWQIPNFNLVSCSRCGAFMRPHHACKACGTYNKREVLEIKEAKK